MKFPCRYVIKNSELGRPLVTARLSYPLSLRLTLGLWLLRIACRVIGSQFRVKSEGEL